MTVEYRLLDLNKNKSKERGRIVKSELELTDELQKEQKESLTFRENASFWVSLIPSFLTVITLTIMQTVAVIAMFSPPAWVIALVVLSGLLVDGLMFPSAVAKVAKLLLGKGVRATLEEYVVTRELETDLELGLTDTDSHQLLQQLLEEEKITAKQRRWFSFRQQLFTAQKNKNQKEGDSEEKATQKAIEFCKKTIAKQRERWQAYRQVFHDTRVNECLLIGLSLKDAKNEAARRWALHLNELAAQSPNSPLAEVGLAYEDAIYHRCRSEIETKSLLTRLSVILAFVATFGFGFMAFNHILSLFMATSITGLVVMKGGPIGYMALKALAFFDAGIAGLTYGLTMLNAAIAAIRVNIFRVIIDMLGVVHPDWKNLSRGQKTKHVLFTTLKCIPVIKFTLMGVIATTLFAGSMLDGTITFFVNHVGSVPSLANVVANILIFGVMMPMKIIFSIKHSIGSMNKLSQAAKAFWHKASTDGGEALRTGVDRVLHPQPIINRVTTRISYHWLQFCKGPVSYLVAQLKTLAKAALACVKLTLLAAGFLFTVGMLVIHTVAEGALFSGEGVSSIVGWPGHAFRKVMTMMRVNALKTAIFGNATVEFAEHLDWILEGGRVVIDAFVEVPKFIFITLPVMIVTGIVGWITKLVFPSMAPTTRERAHTQPKKEKPESYEKLLYRFTLDKHTENNKNHQGRKEENRMAVRGHRYDSSWTQPRRRRDRASEFVEKGRIEMPRFTAM